MWTFDPVKGWLKDDVVSNMPPPSGTPYWYKDKTGKWQNMTFVPGEPGSDPAVTDGIGPIDGPPHEDTLRIDGKNIPRDDFAGQGAGILSNDPDPTGRTTGSDAPKAPPTTGQTIDPDPVVRDDPSGTVPGMLSATPKPGYEYIGGGYYAPVPKTTSVSAFRPGDESREGATIWKVGEDGINRPEQVVTRDASGRHANEAVPNKPETRGQITGWKSGAGETNGYNPSQSAPTEEQYNQSHGVPTIDRLLLDGDPVTRGRTTPYDSMDNSVKDTMSRQLVNSLNDVVRAGGNVVADGVVKKANTPADRARFIQDSLGLYMQDPSRYETPGNQGRNGATDPISALGAYWDSNQSENQKPLQGREQRAKDKKAMNGTSIIERLARGSGFADPFESNPGQLDTTGWTGKGSGYDTADRIRQRRQSPISTTPAPTPTPAPAPTPAPSPSPSPAPVLGGIPNPPGGGSATPGGTPTPHNPAYDSPPIIPQPGQPGYIPPRQNSTPLPPYDPTRPGGDQGQRPNAPRPVIPMPTKPDGSPAYPTNPDGSEAGSVGGWGWKWNPSTGEWESNLPTQNWRQNPRPDWRRKESVPVGGAGPGQGNFRYW